MLSNLPKIMQPSVSLPPPQKGVEADFKSRSSPCQSSSPLIHFNAILLLRRKRKKTISHIKHLLGIKSCTQTPNTLQVKDTSRFPVQQTETLGIKGFV